MKVIYKWATNREIIREVECDSEDGAWFIPQGDFCIVNGMNLKVEQIITEVVSNYKVIVHVFVRRVSNSDYFLI